MPIPSSTTFVSSSYYSLRGLRYYWSYATDSIESTYSQFNFNGFPTYESEKEALEAAARRSLEAANAWISFAGAYEYGRVSRMRIAGENVASYRKISEKLKEYEHE